jgi:hypothetical protein
MHHGRSGREHILAIRCGPGAAVAPYGVAPSGVTDTSSVPNSDPVSLAHASVSPAIAARKPGDYVHVPSRVADLDLVRIRLFRKISLRAYSRP